VCALTTVRSRIEYHGECYMLEAISLMLLGAALLTLAGPLSHWTTELREQYGIDEPGESPYRTVWAAAGLRLAGAIILLIGAVDLWNLN